MPGLREGYVGLHDLWLPEPNCLIRKSDQPMSLVKSFAIGNGDMYYIRHGSDNFSIIDCNLPEDRSGSMLAEIETQSKDKGITSSSRRIQIRITYLA